ncbi:hypothetical protein [Intestinibacter sp.]
MKNLLNEEMNVEQWNEKEICEDWDFPMPTHCLKEKKYNDRVYATLMTISNGGENKGFNNQMQNRYVYENSFDINELAEGLEMSKRTLQTNIKKLESLDCNILEIKNTPNGIVYILNYGEKVGQTIRKYVTINHKILKFLCNTSKKNLIKVYCLLKYMTSETEFKQLTNAWICEQIGLNSKSKNNLDVITDIMVNLENNKLIETKRQTVTSWDDVKKQKITKTQKQYRLCSFEEWNENYNRKA